MGPVLKGLMELQSVETRLRGTKSRLARAKRAVTLQENQLRTLENTLEAKKRDIVLTKSNIDKLELELKSRDESLKKYHAALNASKNNKEYAAILTEININKADNSKIETQILELMKTIELEEAACEDIKKQIEEQRVKIEEVKTDSAQKINEIEASLAGIEEEWKNASKSIPADALDTFKRLCDTYDGEGVAFVEKTDPKRNVFTCGGCFLTLTSETVNQLLTKDDIIKCPSCGRIVVLNSDFEQ